MSSRISCRSCSLVRPTGARRTGSRRPRSGTRRPPATSIGWRAWSRVALSPPTKSGRAATVERWLGWLEEHGAIEPDAAVAVLGALIAAIWGRPAEAERWADAAERATYDGALPDGSALDRLVAGPRARAAMSSRCREDARRRGARGRDARPREPVPAERVAAARGFALCCAGEVDQADDLFADVAEEGLELGAADAVTVALGRARRDRDRTRRMGPGRGVRRPGAPDHPTVHGWRSTRPARSPMRWRLASRSTAATPPEPRSSSRGHSACGRGSPTRCRTSPSRPAWSSRGPT